MEDKVASGVDISAVMQAGRWNSVNIVARYGDKIDARRSGSAKLAMMQTRG